MPLIGDSNARWSGSQAPGATDDAAESVLDMITDTAQTAMPALKMMTRGKSPVNIEHEWIVDFLGAYPGTSTDISYVGEGDDASPTATDPRTRLFNRTGIIGDSWSVSHTQQASELFGVDDEFNYQAERKISDLMRQVYWALLYNTLDVDSNGPNTGSAGNKRKWGGLQHFITDTEAATNSYLRGSQTLDEAAQPQNTGQAATNFAASDLTGVLQTVWSNGGTPSGVTHAIANGTEKELISKTFAPATGDSSIYRRHFGAEDLKVVLPVDIIVTDMTELHLHLDPAVRSGEILGFDPYYWHLNVFRDWEVIELAKTGHTRKGSAEIELTQSFIGPNTFWRLHSIAE